MGDLAGFASALLLAVFALGIAWESVLRFFEPGRVAYDEALWIALLGLLVNLVSAWMLGTGHHHHGPGDHSHQDHNLRSVYFHVLADALTSVLAIAALLAGLYLGWRWADAAVGVIGALVIARWSYGLLRDTAAVLVDASADHRLEPRIRTLLEADGARIRSLQLWRIAPGKHALVATIESQASLGSADYARRLAAERSLAHITVSVQPPSS